MTGMHEPYLILDRVRFTVKIRRATRVVRPEAEQLEGHTYWFRRAWIMNGGDQYPGEAAWTPDDPTYPERAPLWIASGDLVEA